MGKKRKLAVESLEVSSFTTGKAEEAGTVYGHATAGASHCYYPTPSCGPTQTFTEPSCLCLYAASSPQICCMSDNWCNNNCGPV